jgi:predicted O-methyltransferase YrrM
MYLIISYIKFFFKSIKLHGVHSPFVFDLVAKCFRDKKDYAEYRVLEKYNKQLSQSKETILVTDFGSGSRVFRSNERKVSAMAKYAGISKKRQRLLFRLTHYFTFQNTLELGTSLGKATVAFALSEKNNIITVEGCPATADFAEKNLKNAGCKNVSVINNSFENFLNKPLPFSPDCVLIDGNHNYKDTLHYFQLLLPFVHNETVMIFDDIYWSKEMQHAWKEIAAHPKVTVAIDSFYWGMVFFRKEQEKESFTIRL